MKNRGNIMEPVKNVMYNGKMVNFIPKEFHAKSIKKSLYDAYRNEVQSLGISSVSDILPSGWNSPHITESELVRVYRKYRNDYTFDFVRATVCDIQKMFTDDDHNLYCYSKADQSLSYIPPFGHEGSEDEIKWFLNEVELNHVVELKLKENSRINRLSDLLANADISHTKSGDLVKIDQWLNPEQLLDIAKLATKSGF